MAIYEGATPAELTGYGLTIAESLDHLTNDSLARFMPNQNVEVPFVSGLLQANNGTGLGGFRGWDVEGKIDVTSRKRGKFHVDLAPVTSRGFISERDRMTALNGSLEERTRKLVEDSAAENVINVGNRVELARAQAIFNGKILIDDNGFKEEIDFNRPAENFGVLDKLWSDPTTDPLDDLEVMVAQRETITGDRSPVAALMSKAIFRAIRKSKSLRVSLGLPAGSRGRISDEEIKGLLSDIGIAEVILYDYTYGQVGSLQRFTPEDQIVLLPTTVGINDFGSSAVARTFWTRSSESMKPNYGLAADAQFGIVVGAFESEDNAQIFTKADAVVAPGIVHPEYFFVRKVL